MRKRSFGLFLMLGVSTVPSIAAPQSRLKEVVSIEGVRGNQLIGYGLVVGLAGTGDRRQTVFSAQSLTNLLQRMGITVPPAAIRVNNTAAVMVTATLPAFAQPGTAVDVTAAAIGDAANLQGGLLLMTSLRAADGKVYAVAQGPIVTGGFVAGRGGNSQTLNHPTVGRVPNGATVEQPAPSVLDSGQVRLQLKHADFTTAARIADAVNRKLGGETAIAKAENAGLVAVAIPTAFQHRATEFIAQIESLAIETDRAAKVVVNERTGTIVMGKDVRIAPVAILHGGLSVEIQTTLEVSQPGAFAGGNTTVAPKVDVGVNEEKARNVVLQEGSTVEDLVRSLTAIGATPRDIIAILQNLRSSGALEAELEVI